MFAETHGPMENIFAAFHLYYIYTYVHVFIYIIVTTLSPYLSD